MNLRFVTPVKAFSSLLSLQKRGVLLNEPLPTCQGSVRHFYPVDAPLNPANCSALKIRRRPWSALPKTKGEAFYRGDLAEKLVADSRRSGGLLTEEDFGNA